MSKRLWEKGEELNAQVHRFTVGNDPITDLELVRWDAFGSAAHAKMLRTVGLLQADECKVLLTGLKEVVQLSNEGKFSIPVELEDCHTAIETFLISKFGDAGRKIHTGRSRNDQVMLAMRLYLRQHTIDLLQSLADTVDGLFNKIEISGHYPLPGYTHFQPAMPATVGMWLHAFAESFLSLIADGFHLLDSLDGNPLGAASGFGVPLPLDRKQTAELLGFSRVDRSPIAVQNSRGKHETKLLRWGVDISGVVEKLAWDLILYTTREFGFFSLPRALTTGSSIMPQKHNPDVLELLRGRAANIRGAENELSWVIAKLPSNYHRDFQYTKEPVVRGVSHLNAILPMVQEVVRSFTVNEKRLEEAMTPDLYATYDVYREVRAGQPFRDAYRATAKRVEDGTLTTQELASDFKMIGDEDAREILEAKAELTKRRAEIASVQERLAALERAIFEDK